MTDKVQKIREEVEMLFNHVKDSNFESDSGAFYYLKDLLDYIDSLQEEPSKFDAAIQEGDDVRYNEDLGCRVNLSQLKRVAKREESVSEFLNTESMIESYKQMLISQANGMKNSSLIDMCLASYKHGVNETLDTLNLSNVQRTTKNWKESVSEDLEEAVNAYIGYAPEVDESSSVYGKRQAFKAGAKWQKQQMIAKTVETTFNVSLSSSLYDKLWIKGCKEGDKLLVIKKDEI